MTSVNNNSGPRLRVHYAGTLASMIRDALTFVSVDQRQQNALYGVHQMRVQIPNAQTHETGTYRVIVAPADAPIWIGNPHPIPADEHFAEPLIQKPGDTP